MWASLGRLAGAALKYYVVAEVVSHGTLTGPRVRRGLRGALALFVSVSLGVVGVSFLLAALFFHLADLTQFVSAAVVVGVVTLLLATLSFFEGVRLFKR